MSTPVLLLQCKFHTGLVQAPMPHSVCSQCCLRKSVQTQASFHSKDAVRHQLCHLPTRMSEHQANQACLLLFVHLMMGDHTQKHFVCPNPE